MSTEARSSESRGLDDSILKRIISDQIGVA